MKFCWASGWLIREVPGWIGLNLKKQWNANCVVSSLNLCSIRNLSPWKKCSHICPNKQDSDMQGTTPEMSILNTFFKWLGPYKCCGQVIKWKKNRKYIQH